MADPAAAPPAPGAPTPVPFRGSGPFLAKAPPMWIPMRHFAAAAVFFLVFAGAFAYGTLGAGRFLDFDFHGSWVLGLTHTLTLGWVTMTILGALCQLAPVLWETSLAGEELARAAWWLFTCGIAGFVGALWSSYPYFWIPATLLVAAVLLYLFVLGRTMARAPRFDWTGRHLVVSVGYLAALMTLGFLLAVDRERGVLFHDVTGALIAHVHLALIGWVSLTIMGVSYRLVAMFALSHVASKTPGRAAFGLVNAGLIGLAVDALWFGRRLLPLWACLLVAGYCAYAVQMRRIFAGRQRKLDPPLAFTVLAMLGGFAWCAAGLALAFGRLPDTMENRLAYAFLALVGWATPFILGQIHKIVPFLVWLHVYSPRNWKPPVRVPKIQDLTSERLTWAELVCLAPGIYLSAAGFLLASRPLLRAGSACVLACAVFYAANTALTLSHVFRRDPQWTPPSGQP